jgi:hypothetical protein
MRLLVALTILGTAALVAQGFVTNFRGRHVVIEKSSALAAAPILNDWKIDKNGRVIGKVSGHPKWKDGEIISTSAIEDPDKAESDSLVKTFRGSSYQLGVPLPVPSPVNKRNVQVKTSRRNHMQSCHVLHITRLFSVIFREP